MKQLHDTETMDLPGIEPEKRKAGRKPKFGRAMTSAERKRLQRQREKEKEENEPTS
jgi:hypothetical protein